MRWTLLLLLGLPFLWFTPWAEKSTPSDPWLAETWLATARLRTFTIDVETQGELSAARSTSITSTLPGDLAKIIYLIDDGAAVSQGDLLIEFDSTPFEDKITALKAKVAELEGEVIRATGQLEWEQQQAALEAQAVALELCTAEMEHDKAVYGDGPAELERLEQGKEEALRRVEELELYVGQLQDLAEEGFLNPGELAQSERQLREERDRLSSATNAWQAYTTYALPMQLQRAKATLERAKLRHQEAQRSAEHKVAAASAALQQAQAACAALSHQLAITAQQLAATKICAPTDGMIVLAKSFRNGQRRPPQVGDIVLRNQGLIELPDLSQMLVRCHVREIDLHHIRPGMPATVKVDAFPSLSLSATLSSIGVLAKATPEGDKAFEVTLSLDLGDPRLRPGMSARATLHCATVEEALTVPLHALFESDGQTLCYVHKDGAPIPTEVVVGPCNPHYATILSGLDEGDTVSLTLAPDASS